MPDSPARSLALVIDPSSDVAPFEQLRAQVAGRAASGELPAGTRLPTVRALAEALGLATNTVAKAYRHLEADGVVSTEGRRGTFVTGSTAGGSSEAVSAAGAYAASARRLGLTLAEAEKLLRQAW
ncbi:GntR family transcriptional regulator [Nocardioides ferulae]|uniref:GntR family transcriptional regulator n=1 Tax=Nocardioides ferulae TaxID=2340821 RepID=UPI000EB48ADE|nr:GntR family transcriptional regulator [Nocardioides ferulae]